LSFRDVIRMRREEGSMPPILATTNEESLDGHRAGLAGERENVGVPKTFRMDCLAALYIGQCPKPVAVNSGKLVILAASGFRHELGQPCLHASGFAGQEFLRLADEFAIVLFTDPTDARRRAALDLIKQARPRSVREKAV